MRVLRAPSCVYARKPAPLAPQARAAAAPAASTAAGAPSFPAAEPGVSTCAAAWRGVAHLVRELIAFRELYAAVQHEHAAVRLRLEHLRVRVSSLRSGTPLPPRGCRVPHAKRKRTNTSWKSDLARCSTSFTYVRPTQAAARSRREPLRAARATRLKRHGLARPQAAQLGVPARHDGALARGVGRRHVSPRGCVLQVACAAGAHVEASAATANTGAAAAARECARAESGAESSSHRDRSRFDVQHSLLRPTCVHPPTRRDKSTRALQAAVLRARAAALAQTSVRVSVAGGGPVVFASAWCRVCGTRTVPACRRPAPETVQLARQRMASRRSVLALYRDVLRAAKRFPSKKRDRIVTDIKLEFREARRRRGVCLDRASPALTKHTGHPRFCLAPVPGCSGDGRRASAAPFGCRAGRPRAPAPICRCARRAPPQLQRRARLTRAWRQQGLDTKADTWAVSLAGASTSSSS